MSLAAALFAGLLLVTPQIEAARTCTITVFPLGFGNYAPATPGTRRLHSPDSGSVYRRSGSRPARFLHGGVLTRAPAVIPATVIMPSGPESTQIQLVPGCRRAPRSGAMAAPATSPVVQNTSSRNGHGYGYGYGYGSADFQYGPHQSTGRSFRPGSGAGKHMRIRQ